MCSSDYQKKNNRCCFFTVCGIVLLFLFITLSACVSKQRETNVDKANLSPLPHYTVQYAKGFSLDYAPDSTAVMIKTYQPQTHKLLDSILINLDGKSSIHWPLRSVGLQSTTYFAYLESINQVNCIDAICGKSFYLPEQQCKLKKKCIDVCASDQFLIEKLAIANLDALFMYPFENENRKRFEKIGIPSLYVTEYLEETALARLEWLKFFALLFGNSKAEAIFKSSEQSYNALKQEVLTHTVAFNLPFSELWDMPSGQSISAELAKNAGLNYLFKAQHTKGNISLSRETAYMALAKADYWIIVADRPEKYSLADLCEENDIYKTFPSVIHQHVIFCNTRTAPYFTKGLLEPEVLLKDLLICQGKLKTQETVYFHLLR
jgi:iron complex transport system substrate-binding protein